MASEAEPAHEGNNDKERIAAKVERRARRAGAEGKARADRDSGAKPSRDAESRRGRDVRSKRDRDAESKRGRDVEKRGGDFGDDEPLVIYLRDERGAEQAEVPAEADEDTARRNPDWAFAAGISAGRLYGYGAGPSAPPGGAVLLERRVHRNVWLLGELAGGYTLSGGIIRDQAEYEQVSEQWQVRGSAGARFVFTPDSPLRVSGYVVASAGYGASVYGNDGQDDVDYTFESRWRHFGGRLGITVEQALTERMSLGLSSDLVHAGFMQSMDQQFSNGDLVYGRSSTDGYAGLSLQPTVQMRFFFD